MDRLQASNKNYTQYTLKMRYKIHMERIKVIMNRKPGTSKTLDNRKPQAAHKLMNIRYQAMRDEFNDRAAKENRALLKRIGKILTAPASIGENKYYSIRKPESIAKQFMKEQADISYKNKIIFKRIEQASGHYHVKEWENDYKRQLEGQKFVRQVFYTPRKAFTAPEQTKQGILSTESDQPAPSSLSNNIKKRSATTSSHIGRIRTIRNTKKFSELKPYKDMYNIIEQGLGNVNPDSHDESDTEEQDAFLSGDENRKEMLSIERLVRITHDNPISSQLSQTPESSSSLSEGDVSCWLVNNDLLLIIATANSTNKPPDGSTGFVQADADISLKDLASLKGMKKENLMENDMLALMQIIKTIVDTVEICIDNNGEPRLLVNFLDLKIEDESSPMIEKIETKGFSREPSIAPVEMGRLFSNDPLSISQDDLAKMITDTSANIEISRFVSVPIILFEGNLSPRQVSKKNLHPHVIRANVNATMNGDTDAVSIRATILDNSTIEYKNEPALKDGVDLFTTIGLPSIAHADAELMVEYLHNLAESCAIHHNVSTGTCKLVTNR